MKHLLLFITLLYIIGNPLQGQTPNVSFREFELNVLTWQETAKKSTTDSIKEAVMENLQKTFSKLLEDPQSFSYSFDTLKNIGKLNGPEKEFRIFTWNIFLSNNTSKNYGIIQMNPGKNEKCEVFSLIDNTNLDNVGNISLKPNNWYGALYYKVIATKVGRLKYFTLLGLDLSTDIISKKVIDVLYFENSQPILGAPIFNISNKLQSRMVFSFSARVTMMLNYDEAIKTIVYDHLSPSETRYTGQYEYYGPDFSFDGLVFKKGQWIYTPDVMPNKPTRNK